MNEEFKVRAHYVINDFTVRCMVRDKTVTCLFVLRHFNRCNFNRSHFRPLANSTAENLSYLIRFKVIQFFETFEIKWKRINCASLIRQSYVISKGLIEQITIRTKLENDVSELHQNEIRCDLHLTRTTNLKGLWFLVTGFEHFSKGLASL